MFQRSKDIKKIFEIAILKLSLLEKKKLFCLKFFSSGMTTKKSEKHNLLFVLRNIGKIVILKQPRSMFHIKKFQENSEKLILLF